MARKKSRPAPASRSAASTAFVPEHAVTGITRTGPLPADRPTGSRETQPEKAFFETPVGRFLHRAFKVFSSLQQAITLLTLFTLSLITATLIDSWHSLEIAQQVIYRTWWFVLLLFLLGTTIFCAALKKMDLKKLAEGRWPWKKHQTGFLVTHVGLITLVFGGLMTNLGGDEGQIQAIDTDDRRIQENVEGGYERTTNTLILAGQFNINVFEIDAGKQHDRRLTQLKQVIQSGEPVPDSLKDLLVGSWTLPFHPGHLPWHDEENFRSNMPWYLRTLRAIAEPVRGYSRSIGNATLSVNNFLPQTEVWPYSPANKNDVEGDFPALLLRLAGPMGIAQPIWVTGQFRLAPDSEVLLTSFFRLEEPALLDEFLKQPPAKQTGKEGQLVLALGGGEKRVFRFPVDKGRVGEKVKVGDTGQTLELTFVGDLRDLPEAKHDVHEGLRNCPMVRFKLSRDEASSEYLSVARIPGRAVPADRGAAAAEVSAWYHAPDPLWGEDFRQGALQFLQAPDGKIYYRAYGKDGKKRGEPTELDVSDMETVHRPPFKMDLSFQVGAYFPRAVRRDQYVPRNLARVGAEPPLDLLPAIRGALTVKSKDYSFDAHTRRTTEVITDDKHLFLIQCRHATRPLDFKVTLNRAWEVKDPGTTRAAEYHSKITVRPGINGEEQGSDHHLFMNHTVDIAGYRLFQANYKATPYDTGGRLASISGLSVARDPGLYVKYAGTLIVVLGIAIMFWMKAYFFKARGKPALEEPAPIPT
ncbi:MAG: hypothetical protein HYS12_29430 [Planctomycetes bacterium]|nr:hypothetical protein [Planctomycetota bacterium]